MCLDLGELKQFVTVTPKIGNLYWLPRSGSTHLQSLRNSYASVDFWAAAGECSP